jgi:hypothetical protein
MSTGRAWWLFGSFWLALLLLTVVLPLVQWLRR